MCVLSAFEIKAGQKGLKKNSFWPLNSLENWELKKGLFELGKFTTALFTLLNKTSRHKYFTYGIFGQPENITTSGHRISLRQHYFISPLLLSFARYECWIYTAISREAGISAFAVGGFHHLL